MVRPRSELDSVKHELERLNRLHAMLSSINRTIVRAQDPYELYEAACRIAVENGNFGFASIGLLEPVGQHLVPVAQAGAPLALKRLRLALAEPSSAGQTTGAVLGSIQPFVVNDILVASLPSPWPEVLGEVGLRAMTVLPLRVEGELTGAFVIASAEPDYFQEAVLCLLGEVADDVSFALDTMRREEKRIAAESKIQYLAYYDAQTGLPSRVLFAERLAGICAAAGEREVAVLAVSLRQYHGVLQVLGEQARTQLTRIVVGRLETRLPTSAIGRITESEFAIVLEHGSGRHALEEIARQLHAALAEAIPVEGREVFLDPFIGIALHPGDGSAADVLKAALMAAGKGPLVAGGFCRFFVADMDRALRERLDMEAALRRALERREFVLHYQPQVDLDSGCVVGAEALLRWRRPGHGLVPPGAFIPLLEETGLIVPVGEWAMLEACGFARQCQDEGLPPFRVAVNLSVRQFQGGDVGTMTRRALEASGLEPCWLELEITESIVLLNAETVIRSMNELKSLGLSYSLDDFGTGYSSLSYLQRLPVARIKIDRGFIANVTSAPSDAAIVRAIVAMAHSLGIGVIAEGVETEGQLGFLRNLRCEEAQGYYAARPMPADDFRAFLRRGHQIPAMLRPDRPGRYVLAVDNEPNILSALRRVLRRTDLHLLTTTSIQEAFSLLASYPVGVVVCDQRIPEMTGTEFLRRVRELYPATVRIVLSGYTDLNAVIGAINRGAIYKFLTKPWEDQVLIDCLQEAFRLFEMESENRVLVRRVQELLEAGPAGE